jgi:hypothetical protein
MSTLRQIAEPFVAAPPSGARVRARLRVSEQDVLVLRAVGQHLGSLAGQDLAARCREGRLDAKGQAESRAARKRALTAESSSRWAGAITRTSEDAWRLAQQNLWRERATLIARIKSITARLSVPVGQRTDTGKRSVRGYASKRERHHKSVRLQTLAGRLARVDAHLASGSVHVVRGGKALLHKRHHVDQAGLTPQQWRDRWDAQRLFLTADGEAGKAYGNETIRWHPIEGWLEIKLPPPLSHLANRPHGRYRLSAAVRFTYRGDQVAAQAATGAIRYDISLDPQRCRWYLDASWKTTPGTALSLRELRQYPVIAVDVNAGHLAVSALAPDGNLLGQPRTITLDLAGLTASTRDGHLRAAVSDLITQAKAIGARALVIENLDFADARDQGRERTGNRPHRGKRGKRFRHQIAGIPTAKFRDRLTQMATNAALAIIVTDPAYTTRWAAQHWLTPMRQRHPQTSGHHAAALVIGRRGLGHRARRRVTTNPTAPAEATRVNTATPHPPRPEPAPRKPATPRDARQPTGAKTARTHRTTARNQATHDRSGPPTGQDSLLRSV